MINEINTHIERVVTVADAANKVPELRTEVAEICKYELERVIALLGMSQHLEIRQVGKKGIQKFRHFIETDLGLFIRKVYLDVCKTPYTHLYGKNSRIIFCLLIHEYFHQKGKRGVSQKEILEAIQEVEPMSPNTLSQVLSRKKNNPKIAALYEEIKPFINAYILGEDSPLLEVEEI